jgi:glutamyl-tRNA synthetase
VKATVRFSARDLDDLVLLRSDGNPTYNLAVVVDDHDMGVTHVIRGDDHLNNAARQSLIYQALDCAVPVFAHIPLIHGPDGAKLSKRHGAQAVGDFAELGYLPEALRNYLARLGWSHGDDEIFSDEQAISLVRYQADVNKGAARLDWDKLPRQRPLHPRSRRWPGSPRLVVELLDRRGQSPSEDQRARIEAAMPLLQANAPRPFPNWPTSAPSCSRARPLALDDKTLGLLTDETRERLGRLLQRLDDPTTPIGRAPRSRRLPKAFVESEGVGFGKVGPALRAMS